MLNLFNRKKQTHNYKNINGKVVLVKEWPKAESKDQSWGRSGYDSLYS